MKKVIYLDPGHSISDPGAIRGSEQESYHVREVCKLLAPMLRADGFTVVQVPDNLDLEGVVNFINSNVKGLDDAYAFSVHINANADDRHPGAGAEGWHCTGAPGSKEYEIAKETIAIILDKYCEVVGFSRRGVKSDDKAPGGRLWFTRKTKCYAGLIELCFINNHEEITKLKNNYQLIAEGLRQGIGAAFGIEENNMQVENRAELDEIYWQLLHRRTRDDENFAGYIMQPEILVRQELMKSKERAELDELIRAARPV